MKLNSECGMKNEVEMNSTSKKRLLLERMAGNEREINWANEMKCECIIMKLINQLPLIHQSNQIHFRSIPQ